jgi:hypothetical protein
VTFFFFIPSHQTGQHHRTAMAAYLHHASRSRNLLSAAAAAVKMPVDSFFVQGKALVASRDPHEADHFLWLQKFAPNLRFENVARESWPALLQDQGGWAIRSLLLFPNDGLVSPKFFEECARALDGPGMLDGGGAGQRLPLRARLLEILLGLGARGQVEVQGAMLLLPDGSERIVTTDHLILSLGPGACLKIQPPLLKERLADLRLAGLPAYELMMFMPRLLVRWTFNQVMSLSRDSIARHDSSTSILIVIVISSSL